MTGSIDCTPTSESKIHVEGAESLLGHDGAQEGTGYTIPCNEAASMRAGGYNQTLHTANASMGEGAARLILIRECRVRVLPVSKACTMPRVMSLRAWAYIVASANPTRVEALEESA